MLPFKLTDPVAMFCYLVPIVISCTSILNETVFFFSMKSMPRVTSSHNEQTMVTTIIMGIN